ncbi:MAG: RNA polymerase sigma factor [Frankia sp.]|nr:RNA polymerase sigma factor [Frankia sp.]
MDELEQWLSVSYAPAYRTACLILQNPADAEEAVQDGFLRAWRFRDSLPSDPDGVRPWIYRVVVNACCSKLRKERSWREHRGDLDDLRARHAVDAAPDIAAEAADTSEAMHDALRSLPEHLRIPVVLRYYSGLTEAEIATAIRRRPGTVKSRLHEARTRLAANPRLRALRAPDVEEAQ